ncbi:hypothetical protein BGZ59_007545 [Podila verticillata]|nr:hypothetical protein BGZ59_007545 [Podila verticillata]
MASTETSSPTTAPESGPKILIIGAGLGGLALAILLEKAGADFLVLERSPAVRNVGTALSLAPNVQPLFEQLGLLEELKAISKPAVTARIFSDTLQEIHTMNVEQYGDICGYHTLFTTRPDLYNLLLSHVSPDKILSGKRVLSIKQNDVGVSVHCADGSDYHGDVLVGCDGAHSSVRQSLYRQLHEEGRLPSADDEDQRVYYMSVLGITGPMDPKKYPSVAESLSRGDVITSQTKPNSRRTFTVLGDRICWSVGVQMESTAFEHNEPFKSSEWMGSESSKAIGESWMALEMSIGGTLGDLVAATDPEAISKVYFEEKLYTTWYHNRVVLMGDGEEDSQKLNFDPPKMLPNAGLGAVNAILDAVILANALFEMREPSSSNIQGAFKEYYTERYPRAQADFHTSKQTAQIISGQRLARFVVFKLLPDFTHGYLYAKSLSYRPQASFLPLVEKRGSGPLVAQKPSKRYEEELAKKEEKKASAAMI